MGPQVSRFRIVVNLGEYIIIRYLNPRVTLKGWMEGAWLDGGRLDGGGPWLDGGHLAGWRLDGGGLTGWMEGAWRRCLRGGGSRMEGWSGSAVRFARFVSRVGSAVCGFLRFTGLNGSWRFGSGLRFGSRPSCKP